MRQEVEHCTETGKYCYSSEAKAERAKRRYDDINRVYHCDSCDCWHTTKMGVGLAVQANLIPAIKERRPGPDEVEARLIELKKKQDEGYTVNNSKG
jgi:hypothetical protein